MLCAGVASPEAAGLVPFSGPDETSMEMTEGPPWVTQNRSVSNVLTQTNTNTNTHTHPRVHTHTEEIGYVLEVLLIDLVLALRIPELLHP